MLLNALLYELVFRLSTADFEAVESRILAAGYRFAWSAGISVDERPDAYRPREGAQLADAGFAHPDAPSAAPDAEGRALRGIGEKVVYQLRRVLGQEKLLQWTGPGVLHALTFWGFLVIQTTLIETVGEVFDPEFVIPVVGHWAVLGFFQDLFILLVAGTIVAFAIIRLAQDPRRLGRIHNRARSEEICPHDLFRIRRPKAVIGCNVADVTRSLDRGRNRLLVAHVAFDDLYLEAVEIGCRAASPYQGAHGKARLYQLPRNGRPDTA